MIQLAQIKSYFPDYMQSPNRKKYMLKEYIQLMILDYPDNNTLHQKAGIYRWDLPATKVRN
jgi:hypothetical protein